MYEHISISIVTSWKKKTARRLAFHKIQPSLRGENLAAKRQGNHEYRGRRDVKEVAISQGRQGGVNHEQVRFAFSDWLLILSFFFGCDQRDNRLYPDKLMSGLILRVFLSFVDLFHISFHLNRFFFLFSDGIPIRSTLSPEDTDNYAALVSQLAIKAAGVVRTLDDSDELAFLRIRFVNMLIECEVASCRVYVTFFRDLFLSFFLPTTFLNLFWF